MKSRKKVARSTLKLAKSAEAKFKEADVRYVGRIPKKIPPGRVLMHNLVTLKKDRPIGDEGFRAWTGIKPLEGFVPCPCGWSGLPHYAHPDVVSAWRRLKRERRRTIRTA
jgi:hypothetical protein